MVTGTAQYMLDPSDPLPARFSLLRSTVIRLQGNASTQVEALTHAKHQVGSLSEAVHPRGSSCTRCTPPLQGLIQNGTRLLV